jgi:hypothetical protein
MAYNKRGVLKDCLERLYNTYEAAGGEKFKKEEELQINYNETGFEANKLILAKKLELIREKINQRDELVKTKKGNSQRMVKLNNDIRLMIRFVRKDFDLIKSNILKARQSRWFKKNPDPSLIETQDKDLEIIEMHLKEVEALDKRRFGGPPSFRENNTNSINNAASDSVRSKLMGTDPNDDKKTPLLKNSAIVLETDLLEDPRDTNLPHIDISKSLLLVEENKKKMDEGLDIFSSTYTYI